MKISQIVSEIGGEILCSADRAEEEIVSACAFDMMSDVLAYVRDQNALITGLVNPQVVRTAVMVDMILIIFVRGKKPTEEMIKLAETYHIVFATTELDTFETAGRLYAAGLKGC